MEQQTFLVFGATGRTGRPFVDLVLREGHRVRALTRDPAKHVPAPPAVEVWQGSVTDDLDLDRLLDGVHAVVVMIGDAQAQRHALVNTGFIRALVPAMRRQRVTRLLYQAGGLSAPPDRRLPVPLHVVRGTLARAHLGQHRDNEAVMRYLAEQAHDIEWVVHRAALRPGGGSRGSLRRSDRRISIATFEDCADYSYRLLADPAAIHTSSGSRYQRGADGSCRPTRQSVLWKPSASCGSSGTDRSDRRCSSGEESPSGRLRRGPPTDAPGRLRPTTAGTPAPATSASHMLGCGRAAPAGWDGSKSAQRGARVAGPATPSTW